MIDSSVLDFAFGIIAVNTLSPRFNKLNTGTLPAAARPSLADTAKVTLVGLHLTRQIAAWQLTDNELA
jgi:hypothetical protein